VTSQGPVDSLVPTALGGYEYEGDIAGAGRPLVPTALGGYKYEGDITGTDRLTCTHSSRRI